MSDILVFPAGRAIQFTHGEYSDFGNVGAVVTLKDCDLKKLVQEFYDEEMLKEDSDDCYYFEIQPFVSWLITKGYCFPAEIQAIHLGSYGRFDDNFKVKTRD